jgi:hypothetical protein
LPEIPDQLPRQRGDRSGSLCVAAPQWLNLRPQTGAHEHSIAAKPRAVYRRRAASVKGIDKNGACTPDATASMPTGKNAAKTRIELSQNGEPA